ncbi:Lysophospholipase L1 [Bryocella elongata]|uniref:Lysophospholipase L1 n=1 Tax=Bryocella elongata TaxID=863522 RepID=A0A1H5T1C4_9BACT|nr:rhamnogalacturonan acetylesterase [Bryocella elongata]SEF56579.1 Lysophospholipase L1 [Bryocella elongata]
MIAFPHAPSRPDFRAALLLSPLVIGIASAQSPEHVPDRPPDTPTQSAAHHDAPLNPALPTIFIVGDSTARNNADLGWGDHFAHLFDTSRVNVANRAIAGRSSRTYINEGHWQKVLDEMKSGDYVLLQMGHNDGGDLGGAKPRGSLKGVGDESQDVPQTAGALAGKTETVHTYGWYLRKMIDEAKAKGAHPILLTLTVRNIWKPDASGKPRIERDMGYTGYEQQIAAQEQIPLIYWSDLAAYIFESLGPEKTAALFPVDHTHTSSEGAEINAKCVAQALRDAHSPLAAYMAGR